jgi:hypothetical protein
MADRLRRVLEYLEQPLDPLKIPPGETAFENPAGRNCL